MKSDNSSNRVYFDDSKVTPTNVVQYNEYYPFQSTTQNSWTRENAAANNFLGNGGTELNTTTGVMDLHYRGFDPLLGRMNQVDPAADNFPSHTPYNYSFNSPTNLNDPLGDAPLYTETERILHGMPMVGGRVMDYGTAGGHITRGSGGHWADGMDMGADLIWMSRSTFERTYNVDLSNPNDVWGIALGLASPADGNVQYDRNANDSYNLKLRNGRVGSVERLFTRQQLKVIAAANRVFGYGAGPMAEEGLTQSGVMVTVTGEIVNQGRVTAYPLKTFDPNGNMRTYSVPYYRVIVTGTDVNGKVTTKQFSALRFGVYSTATTDPTIVGISAATGPYNLQWSTKYNGGAWQIMGLYNSKGVENYFIHIGPSTVTNSVGGNGCIEILGGVSGIMEFNNFIRQYSGSVQITFEYAVRPDIVFGPSIKPRR